MFLLFRLTVKLISQIHLFQIHFMKIVSFFPAETFSVVRRWCDCGADLSRLLFTPNCNVLILVVLSHSSLTSGCTKKIGTCLRCPFTSALPASTDCDSIEIALSSTCFLIKLHSCPNKRQWHLRKGIHSQWRNLLRTSAFTHHAPLC